MSRTFCVPLRPPRLLPSLRAGFLSCSFFLSFYFDTSSFMLYADVSTFRRLRIVALLRKDCLQSSVVIVVTTSTQKTPTIGNHYLMQ
jgi:hypothetical protein